MDFPVTFPVGPARLSAHLLFEMFAYAVGFQVYRRARRREGDHLPDPDRWTMIVAVVLGAAVGSKVLHHLAHPALLLASWRDPVFLVGGKTIVGALLGGWALVEIAKRMKGIRRRTGDLYAVPLCVGIAVGRIGCFLAGLTDDTHGLRTSLPWGIDFGDGVPRHPTALYEIVFVLGLAALLSRARGWSEGSRFRGFMVGYLGWRFLVDFLKPHETVLGLGVLQWACLAALPLLVRGGRANDPASERVAHG